MIEALASAVVASAGLYFVALGVSALLAPSGTSRFLLAFASTPTRHYVELSLRIILGGAFILAAPRLPFSGPFTLFGWVLLGTTMALVVLPWRWHDRFARRAVPEALRFLPLVGVCSVLAGALIVWAVWRGNAA